MYAGTDGGLIKSLDGGFSWRVVNTVMGSHGRDRAIGQVSSLVVDPLDSQTVYATARCAGFFRSTDGGRRWRSANAVRVPQCQDLALALAAYAPRTVYAVYAWRGVFKSTDGGVHWRPASSGLATDQLEGITALASDPANATTLYAATSGSGIFRSTDAGSSWHPFSPGLAVLDVKSLAIDATGRTLYAGSAGGGVVALRASTN